MNSKNWTHEDVSTNGIRLHCVTQGEGPLLIFLHGFPEFWYSWRHQITEFSRDYKVVAPDLRGYNLSEKPKSRGAYTMDAFVEDVKGLIHAYGYEKATIVAHDWGAAIAWMFAHEHPEMVEKLAILNVPHPAVMRKKMWTMKQLKKSWYMFFFQVPFLPERFLSAGGFKKMRAVFAQPLAKKKYFLESDLKAFKEAAAQPGAITAMLNYYRNAFRPSSATRRFEKLDVPTLMIWGEDDQALGKELTFGTEKYVKNFKIKYIPDCSHWVQQERPDLVNRYLWEFFA